MSALGRIAVLLAAFVSASALAAPSVTMTAPGTGGLYLAPATFAVKANASVGGGATITQVEFYANGVLINTDISTPYQFDWTGVAAGTYAVNAIAYDSTGAQTTSASRTVTVAATNVAPTVSLSAPADNARYLNPSSVTLSATAGGPELNDIIQKVEFYLNGTLANTIASAPFSYAATPAVGTYTLTAVATDGQGAQTTSAPRTFIVSNTNQPPTVSLVTPLNNSAWNGPATVPMSVSVNAGEANDTVSVEFFANGTSIGTRPSAPYSITANLTAATYVLTAVATDGQGAQSTSVARTITVSNTNLPPTVSLTSPTPNQAFGAPAASITLAAAAGAGETNGSVSKVEFHVNGTLIHTRTSGPFTYNWTSVAQGNYTVMAKAYDNFNASTASTPVNIKVGTPESLYFIHADHLNTPRLVVDDVGTTVWKWDNQEPFGNDTPNEDPDGDSVAFSFPLRFPGQYFDRETNLAYNYSRNFDSAIGGYKESDPIGLRGGLNTYAYVAGNPLVFRDPSGELVWIAGAGIAGAIAGAYIGVASAYAAGAPTSGQVLAAAATGAFGGAFAGISAGVGFGAFSASVAFGAIGSASSNVYNQISQQLLSGTQLQETCIVQSQVLGAAAIGGITSAAAYPVQSLFTLLGTSMQGAGAGYAANFGGVVGSVVGNFYQSIANTFVPAAYSGYFARP